MQVIGKCKLSNSGSFTLDLGERVAALLGEFTSTVFGPNTNRVSVNKINVNSGLEDFRIECAALDQSRSQTNVGRATVLTTLRVTSKEPLYGSVQEFFLTWRARWCYWIDTFSLYGSMSPTKTVSSLMWEKFCQIYTYHTNKLVSCTDTKSGSKTPSQTKVANACTRRHWFLGVEKHRGTRR